jgi:hypothetical protein
MLPLEEVKRDGVGVWPPSVETNDYKMLFFALQLLHHFAPIKQSLIFQFSIK